MSVNNSKLFWKHIKNITSNKNKPQHTISIDEWYEHFKTLFSANEDNLNNDNENNNTEIGETDFDNLQNIIFN